MEIKKCKCTESNIRPEKVSITKLDQSVYELQYNNIVAEKLNSENETIYIYDNNTMIFYGNDPDEMKGFLIGLLYSNHKEYSIINKGIKDPNDPKYLEYINNVNECKAFVDIYFNIKESEEEQ